jgi:hypothetical protein
VTQFITELASSVVVLSPYSPAIINVGAATFGKTSEMPVDLNTIAGEYGERTTTLEAKEVVDLIEHGDFLVYNTSSLL